MTPIPWPLSTMPGQHPQESGGRLINAFAEPLGEDAKAPAVRRRVPGITAWGTSGGSGYRGGQLVGATFYAAWNNRVERYTSAGGAGTLVGTLAGSVGVFWARNNKLTPDLVVVAPGDGAFVVTSGAVNSYPDLDLPQPNSVCFLLGFFIFSIGDGRVFSSDINSTAVNALNFATAESKPDTLYRAIPLGTGQLLLAGSSSMEVWGGPVNTSGFPFSYITTIPRGIAGPYAIAGHEDGFGKGIFLVADDNAVYTLTGYQAEKISPPDLDRLIEAVSDKTSIEVTVFVSQGHAFVVVQCPAWSWIFDVNNGKWHERQSHLLNRWRGKMAHNAYGKWLVGDTQSGAIGAIEPLGATEFGNPLRMRVESGNINTFPNRARINRIDIDVTTGVGEATGIDPIETDPDIEISYSGDGGVSWSQPILRKLGRQAKGAQRVTATRCGRVGPQGFRVRVDVSNPVNVGLMGGEVTADVGAK